MDDAAVANSDGRQQAVHDCWNTIGVRGDKTCPKLARYAHCRNCPVHSASAIRLLDRDLPAGYLDEWTDHFAKDKPPDEDDARTAILFRIGSEWFALPTLVVHEITQQRPVHSLPHQRGAVLGLVNVRGELLICVSLARMLGLAESTSSERASIGKERLIVTRHGESRIAFPVDEVQSIHRYQPRHLKRAPATVVKSAAAYTKAVLQLPDKTVGYLDDQLLIQTLNRSFA